MANLKEVRNRIASTQSTQQITKAMKMVSATKLRKAQQAITQMRPYADKLNGILMNLADSAKDEQELQGYFEHRELKNVLLIVNSSDRGLCGGFNSNITKEVRNLLSNKYADANVEIKFLGKKAYEFFKRADFTKDTSDMEAFLELNADDVFKIGDSVIEDFIAGKYDEVRVVYNKFKNAATQIVTAEKILPVELESFEDKSKKESKYVADFSFEPTKKDLLFTIIPRAVKTQLYRTMLDSQASEHGSRMVAMDKATENAGDIIYDLKLQYNQARQAAITTEILEIVGGAAALEG
ncbi:MAG: ATP synthase F1 subunit gamma [Bacteroidota bacterium]|jgi:F-type H+-transporting ATPase subunit gamma|nr:ATP synthase F1 subunit gamma [Bacteroidia bacterium]|tara:strand:+ start:430 stop:1314 length:885 start_codon:yes stop_codon:yes gene_type:complete